MLERLVRRQFSPGPLPWQTEAEPPFFGKACRSGLRVISSQGAKSVGISERGKEIKRRRHRKARITQLKKRLEKASTSEKKEIADKIRKLTPGAEGIIATLGIEER